MSKLPNDTLVLDPQLIEQLRSEGYDYDQEFFIGEEKEEKQDDDTSTSSFSYMPSGSGLQWLASNGVRQTMTVVFFVVILGIIAWYLKKRFLNVEDKENLNLDIPEEDTIYGIDFAVLLREMEQQRNYQQCVRLRYLQLLRHLHDAKCIHWVESKTPMQYVREVSMPEFEQLTRTFLRVRYGNYATDAAQYEAFAALCATVDDQKAVGKENEEV